MADSQEEWEEEALRYLHNEKVRKQIIKFNETKKLIDEHGNEIKIDETVNFEKVENASS